MNPSATTLALAAAACWGVWALFVKLATRSVEPVTALVISYFAAVGVAIPVIASSGVSFEFDRMDFVFAIAGGFATGIGSLLYYRALDIGDSGVISTIVGLYFVVAAVLGILLLGEPVTGQKIMGLILGATAIFLLSS
jgi:uncharacterized membrane protein